jgi:hypothetical protein
MLGADRSVAGECPGTRQHDMMNLHFTKGETAIHEAGHSVVAYLTGYHVIDDSIDIDGVLSGGKSASVPLAICDARLARELEQGTLNVAQLQRDRCLVAVAGFTAEQVYAEKHGLHFDEDRAFQGAHGDLLCVRELAGSGRFLGFRNELIPAVRSTAIWAFVDAFATFLAETNGLIPASSAMEQLERLRTECGVAFRPAPL